MFATSRFRRALRVLASEGDGERQQQRMPGCNCEGHDWAKGKSCGDVGVPFIQIESSVPGCQGALGPGDGGSRQEVFRGFFLVGPGLDVLYIANALKLANKMGPGGRENATFYPDPIPLADYGNQAPTATTSFWEITEPKIFLTSLYWNEPDSGPNSRAMILVHEISHTPLAGDTSDYAYGDDRCQLLVYQATSPFPVIIQAMGLKLVERDVPLKNAASFQYFVYSLSELK